LQEMAMKYRCVVKHRRKKQERYLQGQDSDC
jgi:hypothetical protein